MTRGLAGADWPNLVWWTRYGCEHPPAPASMAADIEWQTILLQRTHQPITTNGLAPDASPAGQIAIRRLATRYRRRVGQKALANRVNVGEICTVCKAPVVDASTTWRPRRGVQMRRNRQASHHDPATVCSRKPLRYSSK
jgi:hypothetical protein